MRKKRGGDNVDKMKKIKKMESYKNEEKEKGRWRRGDKNYIND